MKLDVIYNEDCLVGMRRLPDNSVDSVVTDPPYHLTQISLKGSPSKNGPKGFMGKTWDGGDIAHSVELWAEVFRVLKPGGHLLSFGGSRTYHRMAVAIEDAGFEIRDQIMWVYGSGFPKSLDVSKAIDKQAGATRKVVGTWKPGGTARIKGNGNSGHGYEHGELRSELPITAPATEAAKQWDGWGTALKPAHEPLCLARKPLSESTVAENVLKYGTGALNVDACRIETNGLLYDAPGDRGQHGKNRRLGFANGAGKAHSSGRWPANLILDEEAGQILDQQSGKLHLRGNKQPTVRGGGMYGHKPFSGIGLSETGHTGASRFFYCAKASKRERGDGNSHPTVKPLKLMQYLVRLVTPPGGIALEPFVGSATTLIACQSEGFHYIGFEKDTEYFHIAKERIRTGRANRPRVALARAA